MENKYIKYRPEEFVQDTTFIKYFSDEEPQYKSDWESWLAQNPGKTEEFRKAVELYHILNRAWKVEDPVSNVDKLWEKIDAKTESKAVVKRMFAIWISRAAVVLILVVAGIWIMSPKNTSISSEIAQIENIRLPDNSKVLLAPVSTITYSKKKFNNTRRLSLKGEAFFEVEKGSKFSVNTPSGVVTVLGTSFNVKANQQYLVVECFSGKVSVQSPGGNQVIIEKGQSTEWTIETGQKEIKEFAPDLKDHWNNNKYYISKRPLKEVFFDLQKFYDVKIVNQNFDEKREFGNGFFQTNNLDSALHSICWPMDLHFEHNKDQKIVVISIEE